MTNAYAAVKAAASTIVAKPPDMSPKANAVKSANGPAAAMASPPGSQPNSALNTRTRRDAAPPSASRYPASVNSGMVGSMGETTSRYASDGMDAMGVS